MDSSSEDEDVIIIDDSSDEGSHDGNAAAIVETAAVYTRQQQYENDDQIADAMDLTLQSASLHEQLLSSVADTNDDGIINVDADETSVLLSMASSSSSSSSSGIPSPYKKTSVDTSESHRPPKIIHTASAIDAHNDNDRNENTDLNLDEFDEDVNTVTINACKKKRNNKTSTASNNQTTAATAAAVTKSKAKKQPSKRSNTANRKRATAKSKSKASSDTSIHSGTSSSSNNNTTVTNKQDADEEEEDSTKHYHCYLLRSLHPDHPLKTYIGFTTNPTRRLRQHNGILKNGGANKTKRAGRPWTFVAIIHGFQDNITALQFEWAWQNVDKSKAFREAVGCDKLARKMKRRYGPKARLDELRWLVKDVQPFCLYSLTVYFPEREYCEIFRGIVARGKSGNPYKINDDDDESGECRSELLESLLDIQVAEVDDLPFARDIVAERERKKELRQRKKEERQAAKKKKKEKKKDAADDAGEYSSDISSWLETFDDDGDGDNWSDLLDESDHNGIETNHRDLSAIEEDENSSVISFDVSNDKMEMVSSLKPKSVAIGMDDISSTLQSLSMDCVSQKKICDGNNQHEYDECDFSTISSVESETSDCLMKDGGRRGSCGKENNEAKNKLTTTPGKSCDYFDLCSP